MEFLNMWREQEYSLIAHIDLKAKDARMRISKNYTNEQKITKAEITELELQLKLPDKQEIRENYVLDLEIQQ